MQEVRGESGGPRTEFALVCDRHLYFGEELALLPACCEDSVNACKGLAGCDLRILEEKM